MNEKANEMMRLKFGRIVNLDALEGLTTNKMIGELEESLQEEENKYDIAMAKVEVSLMDYNMFIEKMIDSKQRQIEDVRQELLSVVRKNTNKTDKLQELTTRSRHLEQGLNTRQKNPV